MFEFSIARKYLVPKKKQLSVSLIAMMSVLVISLVVWLLLLFLSVMQGIEKNWIEKLTSLNAPLRINPTPAYFSSYYYQIDGLCAASNYNFKTIAEKAKATRADPYCPDEDRELPENLQVKDLLSDRSLKDPVKMALAFLEEKKQKYSDLVFQDYELSGAMLRLQMLRPAYSAAGEQTTQSFLTQVSYLATYPDKNPCLKNLLLQPRAEDLTHRQFLARINPGEESFANASGIFLSKSYQDNGVLIGDRGFLSYPASTASSVQEQRLPVCVAGFYDPGVMSIGNKCILAPSPIVHAISASSSAYSFDKTMANGIQVWFKDLNQAKKIKQELHDAFVKAGIDRYWKISTFHEYDFAKDLFQQFQSDKYLFTLLGIIILVVACSNIISLLVLLVNDKKKEIGILQSMGTSPKSIATIFGLCGVCMGIVSCFIGIAAALLTLSNIDSVVSLLSFLQGHDAFNAAFYGNSLPRELSSEALVFVLIATPIVSLLAGLVPAIKACRLRPSAILRSE